MTTAARRQVAPLAGLLLAAGFFAGCAFTFLGTAFLPAFRDLTGGDFALTVPVEYFARWRPGVPVADHLPGWQYGPMMHFLTAPLLLLPRWSMVAPVWTLINLWAVAASLVLTVRLSGALREVSWTALLALAGSWLFFLPLRNCFQQGNIELVEMAIILYGLAVLQRGQDGRAGTLIGVAAMLKFLPMGFLGWLLIRRRWRAFGFGVITVALIAALTAVTLTWQKNILFQMDRIQFTNGVPYGDPQTLSVTGMFLHLAGVLDETRLLVQWVPSARAWPAAVAGELASALLAAGFGVLLFAQRRRPVSPMEVAVLFMTMFMLVPWNHEYYFVFALVPVSVLFLTAVAQRRWRLVAVTLAGYAMMSPPFPLRWVDRMHWSGAPFSYVLNYFNVPVIGALLIWAVAAREMIGHLEAIAVPRPRRRLGLAPPIVQIGTAVIVVGLGVWTIAGRARTPGTSSTAVLDAEPPLVVSALSGLAIAPDGRRVAYVARVEQRDVLCVRDVKAVSSVCWTQSPYATAPFFSPDGEWIAFFVGGELRRVRASGGPVVPVAGAPGSGRTGSWGRDDMIVFASWDEIRRIPAFGGTREILVRPRGDDAYSWPSILPSGDVLLFTARPEPGPSGTGTIMAQSLATGRQTPLLAGTQAHYDGPTGRLIYALGGRVLAAPFDPRTLTIAGPSIPLVGSAQAAAEGAHFAVSDRAMVYQPAMATPLVRRALVWVDRSGNERPLPVAVNAFEAPRVSPDGRTLAVTVRDSIPDVWTYDLTSGNARRITLGANPSATPVWTPDGTHIAFTSFSHDSRRSPEADPRGAAAAFSLPFDAAPAEPVRLWQGDPRNGEDPVELSAWSRDGRVLAGTQGDNLWLLDVRPARAPGETEGQAGGPPRVMRLQSVMKENNPSFSPDGKWMAYASDVSGRSEIYVRSFPGLADARRVSNSGGTEPLWSRDGRELFYRDYDWMMAVSVATAPAFAAGTPQPLFHHAYWRQGTGPRSYDVDAAGRYFLMMQDEGAALSRTLRLLTGWPALLAR